jgi:hypothetical protein
MSNEEALSGEVIGPQPGSVVELRVDRAHAVRLSGEAGRQMRDGLGNAVRQGFRVARDARPGEVFELVPPEKLAKGIQQGTLRMAKPARGDASVLVKNVKDGQIAGKADLRKVKPQAMEVLGPAAWQALAMATQQHYLAEISEKLEGIQQGVDELKELHIDDRIGKLNHIRELTSRVRAAAQRDGKVAPHQLDQLRDKTTDAEEVWHQALTTARRHVEQYQDGEIEPEDVTKSFAMLAYAVRVLGECSSALMALPYRTQEELEAVLAEERDRLYPALPEFLKLCDDLLHASEGWAAKELEYETRRPKNPVARSLHVPPMEVRFSDGFKFEVQPKPKLKPLAPPVTERLSRLVAASTGTPMLVAEVDQDQTVLLGPAEPGAPGQP